MSFNILNILKTSSENMKSLTLNQIIDHYDDLCLLQNDPTIWDLEIYINNIHSYPVDDSNSSVSSVEGDEPLADSEWSFCSKSEPEPEKSIEVLIKEDYPEYKNDISFHKGFHWCSRDCEGAVFLCGNSYFNRNGGVTKCGYIARCYGAVPHVCDGHKELYFNSIDSRDTSLLHPLNRSNRSKNRRNKHSFSKYNY